MSAVARGVRNTFRNTIRSFSITAILAISIGLALVMVLAMRAVNSRISSVKSSIGNTITVSPAGARGFEGGGNPLTQDQINQVKAVAHVVAVKATLSDRLDSSSTNLVSSIEPGQLGRRFNRGGGGNFSGGQSGQGQPGSAPLTLPVMVTGTTDPTSTQVNGSSQFKVISGASFSGTTDANVALIGSALATKNNLKTGSTFTAYGATATVAGIYDAGNQFANAGVIMPLPTVQRLSQQPGDITSAIVQVDSISHLAGATSAIQSQLGDAADVVSAQDNSSQALAPLENIKSISLYSLIGALVAGSVIIFLTMLMIVRERRREIGVLKAIGAGNLTIVGQFVVESLTLTLMGAVVGTVAGALLSNPVLKVLASSSAQSGAATMGAGRGFGRAVGGALVGARGAVTSLQASVGLDLLLYGLLAAIAIAVIGSAIPAWLIAKVRPAEVMRAE
ncbi:MAG TPA: FtsX-like permease family protein [Candidatus Saccharimonadia bacterium]|nr:FtsX-like permease family protein [Candidatus Saccharimonadia bacterium]